MSYHTSVLLEESIHGLSIQPGGVYIDGTFGRGGHSRAILAKLDSCGRLIGIDKDPLAIQSGDQLAAEDPRFQMIHSSFATMLDVIKQQGLAGKIDGILLDLGVSSPQLDVAERGFSFMKQGPLDMRMNTSEGLTASEWLMKAEENEMIRVFKSYGEEKFSKRIARGIIAARNEEEITTTQQLVDIIDKAKPVKEKNKHPATRVFQAIRIHINQELEDLQKFLQECLEVLAVGGRVVVISFHSLEDRMVKQFMRKMSRGKVVPSEVPILAEDLKADQRLQIVGKAIKPKEFEIKQNVRARSAVMRVGEKIR